MNFNNLPCEIKKLIFQENRLSAIHKKQKENKNKLLDHITMLGDIFVEADLWKMFEGEDLTDAENCYEYLCDMEHEEDDYESFLNRNPEYRV
jgi:hypothetical protein